MSQSEKAANTNWTLLFLCWLLVSVSTTGSLFFSYVLEFEPCVLCWYQRICLFPLVLILAAGLFPFDKAVVKFALPLAIAGILYFIPYYLNGLAANWELVLFVVGIILIAIELVAIPGFGVLGIGGIVLTVSSLVLVMLGNDVFDFSLVPMKEIFAASATTLGAFAASFILLFLAGMRLTNTQFFNRVALSTVQNKSEGYTAKFRDESILGATGTAFTVLRPAGKVLINGEVFDGYTRGEFILKDDPIIVISEEGSTLLVKKEQV